VKTTCRPVSRISSVVSGKSNPIRKWRTKVQKQTRPIKKLHFQVYLQLLLLNCHHPFSQPTVMFCIKFCLSSFQKLHRFSQNWCFICIQNLICSCFWSDLFPSFSSYTSDPKPPLLEHGSCHDLFQLKYCSLPCYEPIYSTFCILYRSFTRKGNKLMPT